MCLTTFFRLIQIVRIKLSCAIQRYTYHLIQDIMFSYGSKIIMLGVCIVQIQAAVSALRNTRGLPWPKDHIQNVDEDLLDWLRAMFGFQVN